MEAYPIIPVIAAILNVFLNIDMQFPFSLNSSLALCLNTSLIALLIIVIGIATIVMAILKNPTSLPQKNKIRNNAGNRTPIKFSKSPVIVYLGNSMYFLANFGSSASSTFENVLLSSCQHLIIHPSAEIHRPIVSPIMSPNEFVLAKPIVVSDRTMAPEFTILLTDSFLKYLLRMHHSLYTENITIANAVSGQINIMEFSRGSCSKSLNIGHKAN